MSFTDYLFMPLLLLTLIPYFLVPARFRWIFLLVVSVLFFASYGIELLPFAAGAVIIAWGGGMLIRRRYEAAERAMEAEPISDKKERAARQAAVKRGCKYILWASAALILGVLIYTKTQRQLAGLPGLSAVVWFFSKVYQHLARAFLAIPGLSWFVAFTAAAETYHGDSFFVPLGISYYTMSLAGYLADVYWKKEQAERNPFRLALFALYFPKILEGPISKHRLLAGQLENLPGFDYTRFCHGLQRMLWGYLKKLCIADRLNLFVSPVFAGYESYHGSVLLLAALFGAFQLYCDFSGCMDIALGLSEILGIRLEENFDRPFASESAAEFWRRWHITLGVWFKDYIYMPLVISPRLLKLAGRCKARFGKQAGKQVMTIVPLAAVWLLTGLWHGTGWNYILWGLYWGALIICSTVFAPQLKRLAVRCHMDQEKPWCRFVRRVRTFLLFVGGRLITLPGSLAALRGVLRRIFFRFGPWCLVDQSIYNCGLSRANFWLGVFLILFLLWAERKQGAGIVWRERIDALPLPVRWGIYLGGIFFVLIFGIYGAGYDASAFVYMNY